MAYPQATSDRMLMMALSLIPTTDSQIERRFPSQDDPSAVSSRSTRSGEICGRMFLLASAATKWFSAKWTGGRAEDQ